MLNDMESINSWLWTPRQALSHLHHGHLKRKEIKTINLYFHAFYNQNIVFHKFPVFQKL